MCKAQICVTILMACEHVSVSAIERERQRECVRVCVWSRLVYCIDMQATLLRCSQTEMRKLWRGGLG